MKDEAYLYCWLELEERGMLRMNVTMSNDHGCKFVHHSDRFVVVVARNMSLDSLDDMYQVEENTDSNDDH